METVLRIQGRRFDVAAHLAGSRLNPCKSWRVGERIGRRLEPAKMSGLNILVASHETLRGQIAQTLQFLQNHHVDLQPLVNSAGVESLTLDFSVPFRGGVAEFNHFPVELVQVAANYRMGIELSQYCVADEAK